MVEPRVGFQNTPLVWVLMGVVLGMWTPTPSVGAAVGGVSSVIGKETSLHEAPLQETTGREQQNDEVRAVFESYKRALMLGNGDQAMSLVDHDTLTTFQRLRDLAMSADERTVRALTFVERLLVLSIRHSFTPEQIGELSMAELIRTAVEKRWLQPATVAGLGIGSVHIEGDNATAQAISPFSAPTEEGGEDLAYEFVREGGEWKFRFGRLLRQLDDLVGNLFRQLGADEDAILITLIENLTGTSLEPQALYSPEAPQPAVETPPRE